MFNAVFKFRINKKGKWKANFKMKFDQIDNYLVKERLQRMEDVKVRSMHKTIHAYKQTLLNVQES